jgi:hypothetical protein
MSNSRAVTQHPHQGFVKIPKSKKQYGVGVLAFDIKVLFANRRYITVCRKHAAIIPTKQNHGKMRACLLFAKELG